MALAQSPSACYLTLRPGSNGCLLGRADATVRHIVLQMLNSVRRQTLWRIIWVTGNTWTKNAYIFDIGEFSSVLSVMFISSTLSGFPRELSLYSRRITSLFTSIFLLSSVASRIVALCHISRQFMWNRRLDKRKKQGSWEEKGWERKTDKLRSGRLFKLSLTSLIRFFYLNLYIFPLLFFLFFAWSFRFLFPLQRILVSLSVFFYPRSPIGKKKYLYPCLFPGPTWIFSDKVSCFLRRPENVWPTQHKRIHTIILIKILSFKIACVLYLKPLKILLFCFYLWFIQWHC